MYCCSSILSTFPFHFCSELRSIGLKVTRAIDLVGEPKWNANWNVIIEWKLKRKWNAYGMGTLKECCNNSTWVNRSFVFPCVHVTFYTCYLTKKKFIHAFIFLSDKSEKRNAPNFRIENLTLRTHYLRAYGTWRWYIANKTHTKLFFSHNYAQLSFVRSLFSKKIDLE